MIRCRSNTFRNGVASYGNPASPVAKRGSFHALSTRIWEGIPRAVRGGTRNPPGPGRWPPGTGGPSISPPVESGAFPQVKPGLRDRRETRETSFKAEVEPLPRAEYQRNHRLVRRFRGQPSEHECKHCNRPAQNWATIHGRSGSNPLDYIPLCVKCHLGYDRYWRLTPALSR